MKITEVSADALGVRDLVAAAGALNALAAERGVVLACIESTPGSGVLDTLVASAKRDSDAGPPFLGVTVERKPRLLYVEAGPDPDPHTDVEGKGHLVAQSDGKLACICLGDCCNTGQECTCRTCQVGDYGHDHPAR